MAHALKYEFTKKERLGALISKMEFPNDGHITQFFIPQFWVYYWAYTFAYSHRSNLKFDLDKITLASLGR